MTSLVGTFALQPFTATEQTAELSLTAEISRHETVLSIVYTLSGDLGLVVIEPVGQRRKRCDRLWEKTCFECFLMQGKKPSKTSPYWEFNLSPTGDWNAFALSSYRNGLKAESAFAEMPFTIQTSATELQLAISVDISPILHPSIPLRLGISAVILLADGHETFWAVAHAPLQADFHHPDSFIVPL